MTVNMLFTECHFIPASAHTFLHMQKRGNVTHYILYIHLSAQQ